MKRRKVEGIQQLSFCQWLAGQTPYDRLRTLLREWQRRLGGPVPTRAIACETGWPPRTIRVYLAQAESWGLVCRPRGVRSGWAVAV